MKLVVFSLRDAAADEFGRPFYDVTAAAAIRAFTHQVNTASQGDMLNQLNTNPEDFELYELGFFDTSTAQFELYERPKAVIQASKVKG